MAVSLAGMSQTRAKIRFAALGLIFAAGANPGCSDVIWRSNLQAAQRDAGNDGRLVLAYYWSLFDRECLEMDSSIFNDDDVIAAMAGTIPVRLDALWHGRWAREVGVRSAPSFAIYGPDGNLISVRQGPMDKHQFRAFVHSGKLNQ